VTNPFTIQFILFRNVDGFFALLTLNLRDVRAYLFWRKHAPHLGNKSRKLSGEFGMLGGSAGKTYKLLTDDIVERRLEPVACLDCSSRFALLKPNFMMFACTHRVVFASIMLPYKGR
jgi:hypothetical protein